MPSRLPTSTVGRFSSPTSRTPRIPSASSSSPGRSSGHPRGRWELPLRRRGRTRTEPSARWALTGPRALPVGPAGCWSVGRPASPGRRGPHHVGCIHVAPDQGRDLHRDRVGVVRARRREPGGRELAGRAGRCLAGSVMVFFAYRATHPPLGRTARSSRCAHRVRRAEGAPPVHSLRSGDPEARFPACVLGRNGVGSLVRDGCSRFESCGGPTTRGSLIGCAPITRRSRWRPGPSRQADVQPVPSRRPRQTGVVLDVADFVRRPVGRSGRPYR